LWIGIGLWAGRYFKDLCGKLVKYKAKDHIAYSYDNQITYLSDLKCSKVFAWRNDRRYIRDDYDQVVKELNLHQELFNHIFVLIWLEKFYHTVESPEQNEARRNQRQLRNVIGVGSNSPIIFQVKSQIQHCYGHIKKAYYGVDHVQAEIVSILRFFFGDQFKSVWQGQVVECENPMH